MIDNEGTDDVPAEKVMPLRLIHTDGEGDDHSVIPYAKISHTPRPTHSDSAK
jgi:hypothetical protein